MMNVNEWVIAGVFAVSALIYAARKQWENVVTRLFIAMFYAALGLNIVSDTKEQLRNAYFSGAMSEKEQREFLANHRISTIVTRQDSTILVTPVP